MHSPQQNRQFQPQVKFINPGNFSNSKPNAPQFVPLVCQPLLTKYRISRSLTSVILQKSSSIFCSLFGTQNQNGLTLCKCQRNQQKLCEMVMKWIQQYYDWKNDFKFIKSYQNYTKRSIQIQYTDQDLSRRLNKKLQILGIKLNLEYIEMLQRIAKNYMKHCSYYMKADKHVKESDLWMWFLIGIFYHIGASLTQRKQRGLDESIIFWSLDIIMSHLKQCTRSSLQSHSTQVLQLIKDYFPASYNKLFSLRIQLDSIVHEWMNEMMIGYMGIEWIGFLIDCLLKTGWLYIYKIILSYYQKRIQKMELDQIFKMSQDKELITKEIMNCTEEWPLIFCNANSFNFNKNQQ